MFLRGNLARAGAAGGGLIDRGERFEGTYAAAFEDGEVVAVAALYWNGNIVLEAPVALEEVVSAAAAGIDRDIAGILGPYEQVQAARVSLGLIDTPARFDSKEVLFTLELTRLVSPRGEAGLVCRTTRPEDTDELVRWYVAYAVETLGDEGDAALRERARARVTANLGTDASWVLVDGDKRLAMSSFNAEVPDCVQVGGVYTPPPFRGRGYARTVVAASLENARSRGVTQSVLFTDEHNHSAQKAYRALGYRAVGHYGVVLL